MATSLDPGVLNLVEMTPIEDIILALVPPLLPGVHVKTKVTKGQKFPLILVRSGGSYGEWDGDNRFLDSTFLEVDAICEGLNADEDCNLLSEAFRVAVQKVKNINVPGRGYIVKVDVLTRGERATDWADSAGPVQYANLPSDVERWRSTYRVTVRKPATTVYSTE